MNKTKTMQIRLTEEEFRAIKARSAQMDMTVSDFLRSVGSKDISRMVFDPEIHNEIRALHEDARNIAEYLHMAYAVPGCQINESSRAMLSAQLEEIGSGLKNITILIKDTEKGALSYGNNETSSD